MDWFPSPIRFDMFFMSYHQSVDWSIWQDINRVGLSIVEYLSNDVLETFWVVGFEPWPMKLQQLILLMNSKLLEKNTEVLGHLFTIWLVIVDQRQNYF